MVLIDILEEHLEEADFLWQQRENALNDRLYKLDGLAEIEERLLAHLDGLMLAEQDGWQILESKLIDGELGEVFTAASVALASGIQAHINPVINLFADAKGNVLNGIRQALRHSRNTEVEKLILSALDAKSAAVRAAALDVLSFRMAFVDQSHLELFLNDTDPLVVAAVATTVGRMRLGQFKNRVEQLLQSDHGQVRREAMRAGLLVGSVKALAHCRTAIQAGTEEADEATVLVGLAGYPDDNSLLARAQTHPALVRHAISALGWHGHVSAIDPLLPFTADPRLARLAGETISRITGVNLVEQHLVAESSPTAKPEQQIGAQDDFLEDPDNGLPIPDPAKLQSWWKTKAARFDKETRYRYGQPLNRQVLIDILHHGTLPDRHHAAFELALLEPTSPFLETHSFADRQRRELAQLAR